MIAEAEFSVTRVCFGHQTQKERTMLLQTAFQEHKFARKFAKLLFLREEGVVSNCCKYMLLKNLKTAESC